MELFRFVCIISGSKASNWEMKRMKIYSVEGILLWDMDKNLNSAIRPCTFLPPSETVAILQIAFSSLNDITLLNLELFRTSRVAYFEADYINKVVRLERLIL